MRHLTFMGLLLLMGFVSVFPAAAQQQPALPTELAVWDGQSRFNILVLGMDRRPGANDNLNARTDAVLLVSFDPLSESIGVLHIPRDMHLALLENGELVRINTLMVRGERQLTNFGPFFAMDTVQANFGMFIDAYIAFDFIAFQDFIDLIGGVTVDVPVPIRDDRFPDMNFGFDPFFIPRGVQQLDGDLALKYARTRHADNDYLRGERQLQVLMSVRDQLSDPKVVQSLVQNARQLVQSFDGHFYTNIPTEQMVFLGLSMMLVQPENIRTAVLNEDYSFAYGTSEGIVRIPDRELLPQLLTDVFGEDYWR